MGTVKKYYENLQKSALSWKQVYFPLLEPGTMEFFCADTVDKNILSGVSGVDHDYIIKQYNKKR